MSNSSSNNPSLRGMHIVVTASLLGETGTWTDVVSIIKKYSMYSWLALLSQAQEILMGEYVRDSERQVQFIHSFFGPRLVPKIEKLAMEHPNANRMIVGTPDILGIMQEAAILYAPVDLEVDFNTPEARNDTGLAILLVAEILHGGNEEPSLDEVVFEVARQSSRVGREEDWKMIARAIDQYQIGEKNFTDIVKWFRDEFEKRTGSDFVEYYLGGAITYIRLAGKKLEESLKLWTPVFPVNASEREEALIATYLKIRACSIAELSKLVREFEKGSPKHWTLIPLHKHPIIYSEFNDYFALYPTALASSLFDGFYYALIDSYRRDLKGKEREVAIQTLGSKYGQLIEEYVESTLHKAYGDRLIKLPPSPLPQHKRCDFAVIEKNKVILMEIKSARFTTPKYYSCEKPEELFNLLNNKVELGDASLQLQHTIEDLRNNAVPHPLLNGIDWTITTIVPVIVSEENLPNVLFTWEVFFSKFDAILRPLDGGAGRVGYLRFLSIEDLYHLIDIEKKCESARLLYMWGQHQELRSNSLKDFLLDQGHTIESSVTKEGYARAAKLIGKELGFESDLKC